MLITIIIFPFKTPQKPEIQTVYVFPPAIEYNPTGLYPIRLSLFILFDENKILGINMLNSKKMLIISSVAFILFIALVSPAVLPDVTIGVKDAIIITVFVIISDFIVRFISMQEAKDLKNKILLQNNQMETIINNLPFIVCFRNVDGTILRVNQYLSTMFNLEPQEMEGKNSSDFYENPELNAKEDAEVVKTKNGILSERIVQFKGQKRNYNTRA